MIIKCKMCGGDLRPAENATTCECEYCGSLQTLPRMDNERRMNLYDRANHFRRNNEYDKAMGIFEQILQEDRTDAEAYWSLVLCRYGIEYVEDPATKKRIPTVNRTQLTSVFADDDYKAALEYADAVQKGIYEEEAKVIDGIQKGILDISRKEKPFDVFICYKETDAEGKRTPDSVLANDLYHQLTREGFKVFFSRITLEDKLGQQYEPYIFAALNSAKVMVVLGTKPEYFNAAWVKNEWSRFLKLIKAGAKKTLVPAYRDMDPYDLPDEFSHLQAQDMSKLGFMQDLIHGIRKLAGEEKPAPVQQPAAAQTLNVTDGRNAAALLDRAFMALEDGEWSKADDFCEKALNIDARNARAYVGKLMAELKVRRENELQNQSRPLDQNSNYQKAIRFADDELKMQLTQINDAIGYNNQQRKLKSQYDEAMKALDAAGTVAAVQSVKKRLETIAGYRETANGLKSCDARIESIRSADYNAANALMRQRKYVLAAAAFRALGSYRDSQTAAMKCDQLEAQRQAEIAAAQAEQAKREAERRAREEAERREKERVAAELRRRQEEIARREAAAKAAKTRKIIITLIVLAALCVAAFFTVTRIVLPKMNYDSAVEAMQAGQYDTAIAAFTELGDYADCNDRILQAQANMAFDAGQYATVSSCYATLPAAYQDHADDLATLYGDAGALMEAGSFDEAIAAFTKLGDYSDSKTQISEATYRKAASLATSGDREGAIVLYAALNGYKDSADLISQMTADMKFEAGSYADAWTVYAALPEAYQTHNSDYAAMYAAAETARISGDYDNAYAQFIALGGYADAQNKAIQSGTDKAEALFASEKYVEAAEAYAFIGNTAKATESTYMYAGQLAAQGEYLLAAQQYEAIITYEDSQEQHYQMGLQACANGKLADAYAILSADPDYRDAREAIYQTGIAASTEKLYEVSVLCLTHVGAYKDAAMKLTMDTYAWGEQLYNNAEYDRSAEVFASMGDFSDAPVRVDEARYAAAGVAMDNGSYDDAAARYAALGDYGDSAEKANAAAYAAASEQLAAGNYADAKAAFVALDSYSDSAKMARECDYIPAKALYDATQYREALNAFEAAKLTDYKDSNAIMNDCRYELGKAAMGNADYASARDWFDAAGDYSDSKAQAAECRRLIALAAAQELEANGEYEAAYAQYELCGEPAKMQEMAYQTALGKVSAGKYESAIAWYEKAGNYSDTREQILSIGEYYYATQQFDLAEAVYVKVLDVGIAAQRLYELGQYYELMGNNERAAKAFYEAGTYEDAVDKAMNCEYTIAEALYAAQDWEGAKALYVKLAGYKDADSKIISCDNAIAAALDAAFQPGKYVSFGHYPQTEAGNDNTPIEWLVLARDGQKALLLSRYGLDAQPYNTEYTDITWEKCTLRKWLNNDFLNKAFSAQEQEGIMLTNVDNSKSQGYSKWDTDGGNNTQDKVFLLSYAEANKYLDVTYNDSNNTKSRVEPTAYAINQGAYTSSSNKTADGAAAGVWWLRSPGGCQGIAAGADAGGSLGSRNVSRGSCSVRPALWVNLESGIF